MAVRLRLTRVGGKKNPIWRVVATDQRSPRDGRFIEVIGHYNAQTSPSTITLDEEQGPRLDRQGRAADGPGAQAHAHPGHHRLTHRPMRELLEDLARALVDDPDAVAVEQFEEDDGTVVLELSVGDDDYGQDHRPRRAHRERAAHGDEGRGGAGEPPRAHRHRRLIVARERADWLPAGRIGRPHGLDGSFHVTRPRPGLLRARRAHPGRRSARARSCAAPAPTSARSSASRASSAARTVETLRGARAPVSAHRGAGARPGRVVGRGP